MRELLSETWTELRRHDVTMLAGSLAYFGALAVAPLLVIGLAVAGLVLESQTVLADVRALLVRSVGPSSADLVLNIVDTMRDPASTRFAAISGLVVLLYSSQRLFIVLQRALNRIWDVRVKLGQTRKQRLKMTAKRRALAFLMVLSVGVLLLVLVLGNTVLHVAMNYAAPYMEPWLPPGPVVVVGELLLVLFVLVLSVGAIYVFLPDVKLAWRDAMLGAGVTAAGLAVSIVVLARYFSTASPGSVYGAAGSFVVLLLFAYWSAFIFLAGAQLTAVWTRVQGRGSETYEHAEVRGRRRLQLPKRFRRGDQKETPAGAKG